MQPASPRMMQSEGTLLHTSELPIYDLSKKGFVCVEPMMCILSHPRFWEIAFIVKKKERSLMFYCLSMHFIAETKTEIECVDATPTNSSHSGLPTCRWLSMFSFSGLHEVTYFLLCKRNNCANLLRFEPLLRPQQIYS